VKNQVEGNSTRLLYRNYNVIQVSSEEILNAKISGEAGSENIKENPKRIQRESKENRVAQHTGHRTPPYRGFHEKRETHSRDFRERYEPERESIL
jgi:hypothetical protein